MKRSLLWAVLAGLGLIAGGCADQNAPVNQAHPEGWILAHGSSSGAQGNAAECAACHGSQFAGGTVGVACRDCHLEGPPFAVHPDNWANAVISHLEFAQNWSWTGCATAACHGSDLRGGHGSGPTGPSCFSSDAVGCHGDGPPPPGSHRGVNFSNPSEHGPIAEGLLGDNDELDPESTQLYCRNCHGMPPNDFDGGFVADPGILGGGGACSECHPDAGAHPTNWTRNTGTVSHSSTPEPAWEKGCALCHSVLEAGTGPNPQAPSCFADDFQNANGLFTDCHGPEGPGSVPHTLADTWLLPSGTVDDSHIRAVMDGDPAPCLDCHDTGGVTPLCIDCHTDVMDPATITEGTCVSCHGAPPDGNATPNREGAHAEHASLTPSTEDCSACHTDAGSGTLAHFDEEEPADVNLLAVFDGNRGTAVYNPDGSCSDVSCHGGQTTPAWSGELVVAENCEACHEQGTEPGSPEANSYYSGEHDSHVGFASAFGFSPSCSACHDAGLLAASGHFGDLETPSFEGLPEESLREDLNFVGGTCTTSAEFPGGCHPEDTRSWEDD